MSTPAEMVVKTLRDRTISLATAESLTGGLLGATITAVPGASRMYLGGTVAYDTRTKTDLLGVPRDLIKQHTVVSDQVALSMAIGLQERCRADWVIAVTGVAGPDPQDGHQPGEVWICVLGPRIASLPQFQLVERFDFAGDRESVRTQTVETALSMLLRVVSPV